MNTVPSQQAEIYGFLIDTVAVDGMGRIIIPDKRKEEEWTGFQRARSRERQPSATRADSGTLLLGVV